MTKIQIMKWHSPSGQAEWLNEIFQQIRLYPEALPTEQLKLCSEANKKK